MTRRQSLLAIALPLIAVGGFVSVGPPRLVLLNASLRIEYPWGRGFGALAAAAGGVLLASAFSSLTLRLVGGVLSTGALLAALHLLCYRLDATDGGLVSRGVLGTTAIPWRDVSRVEHGPDLMLVSGPRETRIRVDTTDFQPDQRASLERTIARHLREKGRAVRPEVR